MIIPLESYKQYLKITSTTYDEDLEVFINSAELRVKNYLNSNIVSTQYMELLDGNNSSHLILSYIPIISIDKIEAYEDKVWKELVSNVDYYRKEIIDNELFLDGYYFVEGTKNYRITYTAGYEEIPYDIILACKELVKLYFDDSPLGNNRLGLSNISDSISGGQNFSIDKTAEERILNKIQIYRNYYV